MQMRESAKSGVLDGFIMEYQTYINAADLKSQYVLPLLVIDTIVPCTVLETYPMIKKKY